MTQGDAEDVKEDGMVYVSYHIFEHYSSVRNLAGPHKGLPKIKEVSWGRRAKCGGKRGTDFS